ncbi:unnamed protein product [Closterium sp. NIES-53]
MPLTTRFTTHPSISFSTLVTSSLSSLCPTSSAILAEVSRSVPLYPIPSVARPVPPPSIQSSSQSPQQPSTLPQQVAVESRGVGLGGARVGGTKAERTDNGGVGSEGDSSEGAGFEGTGRGGATCTRGASSGGAGVGGTGARGTHYVGHTLFAAAFPTCKWSSDPWSPFRLFGPLPASYCSQYSSSGLISGCCLSCSYPARSSCCPHTLVSAPVPRMLVPLLGSSHRFSPSAFVLQSPPETPFPVSSTPISEYYCTCRLVVSRVLTSLVKNPRASLPYVSALTATVANLPPPAALNTPLAWWLPTLPVRQDSKMAYSTGIYVDAICPPEANVVDGMWIFKVKRPPGSPPVFKAGYAARGFSQREGVDFFQTFTPTPKMTTLWVLLHVAAQQDYELHSLDFSTFFLHGHLHEEIWLRRPPSFIGPTPFFVLVYVDDLVFATTDMAAMAEVKSELQKRYTCTDLCELRRYLGLQITKDRAARTITLTQSHMVQQVLQRFGLQHSTTQPTPLAVDHRLTGPFPDEPFEFSGPYSELVGCLM